MLTRRHRRYLPHLRGSRTLLAAAALFGMLYSATSAFGVPFLLSRVLPATFGTAAERAAPLLTFPGWTGWGPLTLPVGHETLFAVAFLPVVFLLRGVAQFAASYSVNVAGMRVVESVRSAAFARLQSLHLGFFSRFSTGDLLQRLTGDVLSVRLVLVDVSTDLVIQPFTLVFAAGWVLWSCLTLPGGLWFLLSMAVIPLSVFLVRAIGRALQARARKAAANSASLGGIVVENLQSPREVRSYGLQRREQERFGAASREGLRIQSKIARYDKSLSPLLEVAAAFGVAGAVWVGADAGMRYQDLLGIVGAMYFAYEPIKKLGRVSSLMSLADAGLARLEEVMDAVPEVADAPDARPLGRVRGELEFRDVAFAYGEEDVLSGVSVAIPAGQSVALVGPSGAGKSTFIHLVPRFFDVRQGAVLIDGLDVRAVRQADLRANVAVVSQEPVLFDDTVLENVRLGRPSATDAEVREAARLAGALPFIESLPEGFATRVGERGSRLSGGQRQRVAVARAFLKDAPVLILDEATSALDAESEKGVRESLALLMKGRTTLIVAHRFSTIRDAERVLVFQGGRIVADGPRDRVYRENELFRRLWDEQAQGAA
ncbi:MAG: ABC transporter ATP-binding protein [Verrucomicrobiota bacterium]